MTDDATTQPNFAPSSVEIHVHPATVQLGQPFVVDVVLQHPSHSRFELLSLDNNSRFDVLSKTRDRKDGPQESTTSFSLHMAAFELGSLELPPLQFEVTTPTQVASFFAPNKTISVTSSLTEIPSRLEDVRPPAPVFSADYTLLYAAAALLAIALLALALRKGLLHRKKEIPQTPPKPLAERTREALDALRAQALPEQGKIREYYFMLSEIIRGHVGELHHFDALECTTTEFLASLYRLHSTQIPLDTLAHFSHQSDFIKYAKGYADMAQCEADLEFAYRLVDKTALTDELLHHA